MYVNFEEDIYSRNQEQKSPLEKLCPLTESDKWDLEIWKEFKKNNRTAYEVLYKKYYFLLYNYGIRLSKDDNIIRDCIQDLFIDLWRYSNKLTDPKSVKKYLFLSIRRRVTKALMLANKKVSGDNLKKYQFDFVPPHEQNIINDQVIAEQNTILLKTLNQLTPKQKEALYLKYYENLSSPEIASVMSLTINSTYVLISESMKVLKKYARKYLPFAAVLFVSKLIHLL